MCISQQTVVFALWHVVTKKKSLDWDNMAFLISANIRVNKKSCYVSHKNIGTLFKSFMLNKVFYINFCLTKVPRCQHVLYTKYFLDRVEPMGYT